MAHLRSHLPQREHEARLGWKLHLAELLMERSWPEERRQLLFTFLDAIMLLPDSFQERFNRRVEEREREVKTRFLSPIQQQAFRKGREEGIEQGIEQGRLVQTRAILLRVGSARFGPPSPQTVAGLEQIQHLAELERLFELAMRVESWNELFGASE